MKIQTKKRGRGMRAILCGLLSTLCIATCGMNVYAGYTSDNHPKTQLSPDGSAWTLIEELPYYDDYDTYSADRKHWNGKEYSFWLPLGKEISTGMPLNLPNPEVGQHEYNYNRTGNVPVYKWVVEWERSKCIHRYIGSSFAGFNNVTGKMQCYCAYWSGLIPYCADCEAVVANTFHYISEQSAKEIQYVNVDKGYFYFCPHNGNLEQAVVQQGHVCRGVSYNQYIVVYDKAIDEARGTMVPSWHMYDDATEYNGEPREPQKNLSLNRYELDGYEFLGWNTKKDGTGTFYGDGASIFNLTTENYDPDDTENPNKGVVTLYAQWGVSKSHLKIDTKGGKYDDGRGRVSGDKTTYENIPKNSKLTLKEEYLTPPKGYKVSFVTNCATSIAPMQTDKIFNSWKKGSPFTGRLVDNVFEFLGPHNSWSVIEATYDNGSIILPGCTNGDETLVGWYEDSGLTKPVGVPGDEYTPSRDITLYADWEKDLVLYADNDLTVDGGKGGVDLRWEAAGGLNKAFKIYQKLETEGNSAWRSIMDANNIGNDYSVSQTYTYSGTSKTYTVPYSGFYSFDVYGAQGQNYGSSKGGKGGFVTANIWLNRGDVLTITVGGQNGYNGGGGATKYGKGGGCSVVESREKGVLLVAGGGGGAADGYNGGEGGAETSLVANGSNGATGMAGGGGGYKGGNYGEVLKHNHVAACEILHQHVSGCYEQKLHEHNDSCGQSEYWYCGAVDGERYGKPGWCPNCGDYACVNGCKGTLTDPRSGNPCCVHIVTWNCGKEGKYETVLTCGKNTGDVVGLGCAYADKPDGYVYDATGGYGGSNYVNTSKVVRYDKKNGMREGNGCIKISSSNVGYQVTFAMDNVSANDKAKPDAIDNATVTVEDDGTGAVLVKWGRPEDNGTTYNHWAQSFNILTGDHLCDSNITTNTITTGVKKYYYYYGASAVTVTATNKQGAVSDVSGKGTARVSLPENGVRYFCVAAVDAAGNVGPTYVHTFDALDIDDLYWFPKTKQVTISSNVGGRDYKNVYQKDAKTYYVKADGYTPFKLAYDSNLTGSARTNYQIDNLLFNITSNANSKKQVYETIAARTSSTENGAVSATITGRTATGDGNFFRDAQNSGVSRKRKAIDVSFYQSFKIPSSQNGSTLTIVPVAGASYVDEDGFDAVKYSDWARDLNNALYVIPDAEAPVISGANVLESMTEYNRDSATTITLTAMDLLSGVRDFKATVRNLDNGSSSTYRPDAEGKIIITIDNSDVLFYGALKFEIEATDNVGNVNKLSYGSDNLGLEANVNKTVPDGRTTYAQGEGARLDILTTGYAERVEIVWPAEFGGLTSSFDYTGNTEFARTECVPFIIPRADKTEYEIIVRAYKNGMSKEERITLHIFGEMSGRVRIR